MTNFSDHGFDQTLYLSSNFREFNSAKQHRFNITKPTLNISTFCSVGIFPSSISNEVLVEIDADTEDLENFRVFQEGNTVVIEQINLNNSDGNVIIGNSVVMSGVTMSGNSNVRMNVNGQDIRVINGKVYVNGVQIDGGQPGKTCREPKIRILTPVESNLDAKIKGSGILASKVPFQSAEVQVQGQADVGLAAYELDLQVQGQGKSYFILGGGKLDIKVSGQGNVYVQGKWSNAKVSLSGMGKISTEGTCTGDYKASVSGMGEVRHSGSVMGRIKESKSGMGSINIQQ